MNQAIEMFTTIQEFIGPEPGMIRIPADAILRSLPDSVHGPEWSPNGLSTIFLELDRDVLLHQLQRGRVAYSLADLSRAFPPKWLRGDSDELIELPLSNLVAALPADLLHGTTRVDDEVIAASQIRDFFLPPPAEATSDPIPPAGTIADVAVEPEETPDTDVAETTDAKPAVFRTKAVVDDSDVTGWDGVERQPDASANFVDLNLATAGELETLPGVGSLRALWILEYRQKNGPFRGVYDLLRVPGIGRKLFRQITGLRAIRKNRKDRHEELNRWLDWPAGERPSLNRIMERSAEVLGAIGGVLSGPDGILLAQSGLDPQLSDRYAAFTPNFFRKTRRYWPMLGEDRVQQVVLPGADPKALLTHGAGFSWILLFPKTVEWQSRIEKAALIGDEINWLFGRHAVVRRVETPQENP